MLGQRSWEQRGLAGSPQVSMLEGQVPNSKVKSHPSPTHPPPHPQSGFGPSGLTYILLCFLPPTSPCFRWVEFFKIILLLLDMNECFACMRVCEAPGTLQKPEDSIGFPETRITEMELWTLVSLCVLGIEPGASRQQQVFLITERSLRPLSALH